MSKAASKRIAIGTAGLLESTLQKISAKMKEATLPMIRGRLRSRASRYSCTMPTRIATRDQTFSMRGLILKLDFSQISGTSSGSLAILSMPNMFSAQNRVSTAMAISFRGPWGTKARK